MIYPGRPLSPTLFNIVMDAVIHHWVVVVAAAEVSLEGLGMSIKDLAAYLYADDGLVASTQPKRMLRVFDVLAGLFE